MAGFIKGDVVVILFPLSDLSGSKRQMHRTRVFCYAAFLVISTFLVYSCRKENSHTAPGNNPAQPFPQIPYDTTNVSGELIATFSASFSYFNNHPGSQHNGVAHVSLYGHPVWFGWGSGYYYNISLGDDTIADWVITDTNSFSFSYADSSKPPFFSTIIPDTISVINGAAVIVNNPLNADTLSVEIENTNDTMAGNTVFGYNALADTMRLAPSFFSKAIPNNYAVFVVSAFTHHFHTINGYTYLFIKKYDVEKEVWIK